MEDQEIQTETPTEAPPENTGTPPPDTIASNVGDDPPASVPATWPEDWRDRFAGNNDGDRKRLGRFTTPENIWKSFRALESRMSSGEYVKARPDPTNEEAMTAWRQEIGLPESFEGYLEGSEFDEDIKPVAELYADRIFKDGGTVDEFKRGMEIYLEERTKALEMRAEADREFRNVSEDELRSEYGPEYRGNLTAMHQLFEMYGDDDAKEALFSARTADGLILGDHPAVIRMLVNVAREVNPYSTVTPMGSQGSVESVERRIAELQREMSDTRGRAPDGYWNSQAKQEEYRNLLEMQERMESRRRA